MALLRVPTAFQFVFDARIGMLHRFQDFPLVFDLSFGLRSALRRPWCPPGPFLACSRWGRVRVSRRFMDWKTKGFLGVAVLGGMLLTGCGGGPAQPATAAATRPTLSEWYGDGLTGRTRVIVNLTRQVAEVTIGGAPAGWSYVATGKEGFSTPAGTYKIVEKVVDKRSTLYGWIVDAQGTVIDPDADTRKDRPPPGGEFVHAPMPYWMRLTWSGIGLHAGHIPEPGEPASHGCIRLPEDFATRMFAAVKIGTPVTIVR
jgi:hypothetical protein